MRFLALAGDREVVREVFVQQVAVDECEGRQNHRAAGAVGRFEADEQVEAAHLQRTVVRVVDADSTAGRRRVEVDAGGPGDGPARRPRHSLDFDPRDLAQVVGPVGCRAGAEKNQVRHDDRSRRSDAGRSRKIGQNLRHQELVEGIVLSVPLFAQPKRYRLTGGIEEALPQSQECRGGQVRHGECRRRGRGDGAGKRKRGARRERGDRVGRPRHRAGAEPMTGIREDRAHGTRGRSVAAAAGPATKSTAEPVEGDNPAPCVRPCPLPSSASPPPS